MGHGNYLAIVVFIFIFLKMIAVILLTKCSVFRMLWLDSDTKKTNGIFVFCQCYSRHW